MYACPLLARCSALLEKGKDWLAQHQDNVIEWDIGSWCWRPGLPVGTGVIAALVSQCTLRYSIYKAYKPAPDWNGYCCIYPLGFYVLATSNIPSGRSHSTSSRYTYIPIYRHIYIYICLLDGQCNRGTYIYMYIYSGVHMPM